MIVPYYFYFFKRKRGYTVMIYPLLCRCPDCPPEPHISVCSPS
nr:MAG TPA: hypothetical protein [Caudoviricetes sp.]